jgi:hypothetical protein
MGMGMEILVNIGQFIPSIYTDAVLTALLFLVACTIDILVDSYLSEMGEHLNTCSLALGQDSPSGTPFTSRFVEEDVAMILELVNQ